MHSAILWADVFTIYGAVIERIANRCFEQNQSKEQLLQIVFEMLLKKKQVDTTIKNLGQKTRGMNIFLQDKK